MDIIHLIILFLFFTTLFTKSTSSKNDKYDTCSKKFSCGDLDDLGYPFYDGSTRPDYCGYPGFNLSCGEDVPQITINRTNYSVSDINSDNYVVSVYRKDKWTDFCPDSLFNTTIDYSKFNFTPSDQNITFFFDCGDINNNLLSGLSLQTSCDLGGVGSQIGYYLTPAMVDEYKALNLFATCKANLFLPISDDIDSEPSLVKLRKGFFDGFELGLMVESGACSTCEQSDGECGYNWELKKFVCHCADADYDDKCKVGSPDQANRKMKTPLIIGVSVGVVALLALLAGCFLFARRRRSQLVAPQKTRGIHPSISNGEGGVGGCLLIIQKSMRNPQNQSVEDSLKNYASLVPKRYAYKYIKKITRSFREKLGEGGYGMVFKGNLRDGRIVAVKVWKQSEGDGQDFLNEVMSISRTSHVNVVSLLGFCSEGHKRALIYEFMPNGSLDKFIQKRYFSENNQPLIVQKLFEICVGVARGLEYLHRGCNTRIVHFDIKPHNILLDAEFIPKISDFGLAKSSQQKVSLISMSGARGTVGYIAPEVFFRMYGRVSHKSDVYSFGMMVLEMVGCKNKVNDNVENSSEMYFPQWIYKQLELGAYTIDCERILNEEEKELERKMMLVGLWCIQTNPVNRPSMSRVLEMLEGKVELLEVPPMPTLCSPPRQQQTDEDSVSYPSSTTFVPTL